MNHGRYSETPGSLISQYSPQHPALRAASCNQRTAGNAALPARRDAIAIVAAYHGQIRFPVSYMFPKACPFWRKCATAATCFAFERSNVWKG